MASTEVALVGRAHTARSTANAGPWLAAAIQRYGLLAVAVLTVALSFTYSLFMDRRPDFEDIGMFNPVYMYLHYGKMAYPAHGWDNAAALTMHPPVHYLEVANLIRLGFDTFHAAGLPLVVLSTLSIVLI